MYRKHKPFLEPTWATISERHWSRYLSAFSFLGDHRVRRIYPGSSAYEQVLRLRHKGFVESGFLRAETSNPESMRLGRDSESIILGLFRGRAIRGTVTLNTISAKYPGMAMELEKGVDIHHPYFRAEDVLEVTKLVIHSRSRGTRGALALFSVAMLVARMLGKKHLWQVSRNIPSDRSWRAGLGFDYSINHCFLDRSLNDMPSCVGYLYLPDAAKLNRIPKFIRHIYRQILEIAPAGAISDRTA